MIWNSRIEHRKTQPDGLDEKSAPSVIISRRPCALLKYVKHKPALVVDQEKCVGCRACMKLGCPAISIRGKKAMIDATQCVGCGVCSKLCRPGALGEVTK